MTEISVKGMRPSEQLLFLHSLWIIKKLGISSLVAWLVVASSTIALVLWAGSALPTPYRFAGAGIVALSIVEILQTGFHVWMVRHIRNPETYVRSR